MCGIAGLFGGTAKGAVVRMSEAMASRGPDGHGFFTDETVPASLAHRRLAIIDLTETGKQPMSDSSGRFTIVYNGEIYNYLELREQLSALGHSFRSRSDTEVVLSAFQEWGIECLSRFRGMFAFALMDRGRRHGPDPVNTSGLPQPPYMFLARDRFGIKPLLYSHTGNGFLFASELKAMLASDLVPRHIDTSSLVDYLSYGSVSQPRTMVRSVRQMEPGTWMLVLKGGHEIRTGRYWDLAESSRAARVDYRDLAYEEQVAQTRLLLEEATRYHLVSDVAVGAFLSGGVDSAAVTALMAHQVSTPIKSFSLGFENDEGLADELDFARETAVRLGTEHNETVVTLDSVPELFEDLIRDIDQPSIDGTNTYLVSRAAAGSVKVALSGLGGDELLGGYPHFRLFTHPGPEPSRPWDAFLAQVHRWRPNRYTAGSYWRWAGPVQKLASLRRVMFDRSLARNVIQSLGDRMNTDLPETETAALHRPELPPLARMSYVEYRRYLLNTLLRDCDVMSMARSLEVRPVLLDHVFAEHVFALPDDSKIRGQVAKAALSDAILDLVPDQIFQRPKTGFELPFRTWITGPLRERSLDALDSPTARTVFRSSFLRRQAGRIRATKASNHTWAWLVLIEWIRASGCEVG